MTKVEKMEKLVSKLNKTMKELSKEIHELDIMSGRDVSSEYTKMFYALGRTEASISLALYEAGLVEEIGYDIGRK